MISITSIIFVSLAAGAAGFIDSVAGGGGLLTTPALMLTGLPTHNVFATNKFMAPFGTAAAFWNYWRNGLVLKKLMLTGIAFSLLGAYAGTLAVVAIPDRIVSKIVLVLLPIAAGTLFLPTSRREKRFLDHGWRFYVFGIVICLVIGFYDGFFGPGTGTFLILAIHHVMGSDLLRASATAKAFNLASNIGSFLLFVPGGYVYYQYAIPMAVTNILGNYLGSKLIIRKGSGIVRGFLMVSLALLFISLLFRQ